MAYDSAKAHAEVEAAQAADAAARAKHATDWSKGPAKAPKKPKTMSGSMGAAGDAPAKQPASEGGVTSLIMKRQTQNEAAAREAEKYLK